MTLELAGSLIFGALWSGALTWFGFACVIPALHAEAARRAVVLLATALIASVPLVVALTSLRLVSPLALAAPPALLLLASTAPSQLVRWTGGPRTGAVPHSALLDRIIRAYDHFEVGDVEGWRAALEAARVAVTPATSAYLELWLSYAGEEEQRRSGDRLSSRETLERIRIESNRLVGRFAPRGRLLVAFVAIAMLVAATPPAASALLAPELVAEACVAADRMLDDAEGSPTSTATGNEPLPHLVLLDPGEPAMLIADGRLTLDQAGESRHDPTAREQLAESGFVSGYVREWRTADGRRIAAEIFEFTHRRGAEAYQRNVTEYACRFSNVAFRAPAGVGLQVRYGRGDPILEQASWIDGSRRILVSRSFTAAPGNHGRVLDLAERARNQLSAPH